VPDVVHRLWPNKNVRSLHTMTAQNASYEIQTERFVVAEHIYPVRVTPIPSGTWSLQPQTHSYLPYLLFWAMATVPDSRSVEGRSTWTLWFAFREPPLEHLGRPCHDGLVRFLMDDKAPHQAMVSGFTLDLFVGPGGTIARGQILESHDVV